MLIKASAGHSLTAARWAASSALIGSAAANVAAVFSCATAQFSRRPFSSTTTPSQDSFMQGNASNYIDSMFAAWLKDPSSVHISWQTYFKNMQAGKSSVDSFSVPPSISSASASPSFMPQLTSYQEIQDHMKVQLLVRAYQVRGHHRANLDPLGILKPDLDFSAAPELDIEYYGFSEKDLNRDFYLGQGVLPRFIKDSNKPFMTLSAIVSCLKQVYCGTIGFEYSHIPERDRCDWIRSRIEIPIKYTFSAEAKKRIFERLVWSDSFERFVATKYPGEKRFGLEGCEALIPGMKALIDRAVSEHDVKNIIMGMSHRGRLNVLNNVVNKPTQSIFSEFKGENAPFEEGSGDVKYHLGMNYERSIPNGKRVYLSLCANPSHLEAVNPVVQGKTKAIQFLMKDDKGDHSMGVLIHGDASFAGQGVVYESLGMADLPSYSTGGTIHIVVNNQIGFTTDPRFARSTPYCTELAKAIRAPILHVNADDVEAVVFASEFAADYRSKFKTDVVIDLVCYRRHGHNEFDEPMFTQPRMYKAIARKQRVLDIYAESLLTEGAAAAEFVEFVEKTKKQVWGTLEEAYVASKDYKASSKEWVTSAWHGFKSPKEIAETIAEPKDTGASQDVIKTVGMALCTVPEGFAVHRSLVKVLEHRKLAIEGKGLIDMPTAEALAFGTLLLEGNHVRLSGQDVERGTFSQRHAVLHDQNSEDQYIPLAHISPSQAPFTVCNSHLSEFGVLGFELGYSLVEPRSLICWEAQFGDFANNAQCIIDQFLVSGEKKWLQRTGLTLLLPHGYDGNGPEHSNGRIERFLSLSDENPYKIPSLVNGQCRQIQDCNLQIVYPSTPANYYHVLRRQVHREFRKPLVVFNSKALLRHPDAKSALNEFLIDNKFKTVIPEIESEKLVSAEKIKTAVLCSGQVYYALAKARAANGVKDVAIIRIEQLAPFPFLSLAAIVDAYPKASIVWCQEEHMNFGPWFHIEPRIKTSLSGTKNHADKSIRYAGREPSAASATGFKKIHMMEEQLFISDALFGKQMKAKEFINGVPIFPK